MYLPSVNNSKISTTMSMSLLANTSFPYSLLINAKYTFHFMQYFRQPRQAKHLVHCNYIITVQPKNNACEN